MTVEKNVVVTGFGPFGPFTENPSSDIVDRLSKEGISGLGARLVTAKIPVVYKSVTNAVERLWEEHKPELVVHIGVHSVPRCIKLERQAFALGYCRYDVENCVPENNQCPGCVKEETLQTKIDVDNIVATLKKRVELGDVSLETSNDPGRYLCGFSYYLSLSHDVSKSLFIHVPPFDEEATPTRVTNIVKEIVLEILY